MAHRTKKAAEGKTVGVIQVNEAQVKAHLGEMVRQSVEETLNGMLDAKADRLCRAKRYERTADRRDTRAGLALGKHEALRLSIAILPTFARGQLRSRPGARRET